MFSVVITEKGGAQRRTDFDKTEVTIGRVQGNDIILPKGNVSKRHSRIVLKDSRFIVVDLKSTNGTYVNGRKITSPLVVKGGDKIYIGDFILTLEDAAGASPSPSAAGPAAAAPPAAAPPAAAPAPAAPAPSPAPPAMGRPSAPPPLPRPGSTPAAPPVAAPAPMPGPPAALAAPPGPAPIAAAPLAPPPAAAPPMGAPPMGAPPVSAPAPIAPAPVAPAAAPPGPVPGPATVAPAPRFPLDEEPADSVRAPAPSPRVVASASPGAGSAAAPMDGSAGGAMGAPVGGSTTPPNVSMEGQAGFAAVVEFALRSFDARRIRVPLANGDPYRQTAKAAVDGALAAVGQSVDHASVGSAALEELVALGALNGLVHDTSAKEIIVQGPNTILVDRGQGLVREAGNFSGPQALVFAIHRLLALAGAEIDPAAALMQGTLPNGLYFSAMMPPVALGGPFLELRRVQGRGINGAELVSRHILSTEIWDVLGRALTVGKNVVVVGARSGVSDLCGALTNFLGDRRVVTIEASPSLSISSDQVVRLSASPGTSIDSVLIQGGRLRADNLVIDGVQGSSTLTGLLQLSSRGGCVMGVHSAAGGDVFNHLSSLARLGGGGDNVEELLSAAVQVVVSVGSATAGPRVEAVQEVQNGQLVDLFGANFSQAGRPTF